LIAGDGGGQRAVPGQRRASNGVAVLAEQPDLVGILQVEERRAARIVPAAEGEEQLLGRRRERQRGDRRAFPALVLNALAQGAVGAPEADAASLAAAGDGPAIGTPGQRVDLVVMALELLERTAGRTIPDLAKFVMRAGDQTPGVRREGEAVDAVLMRAEWAFQIGAQIPDHGGTIAGPRTQQLPIG
jgi:hypothetical protein